MSIVKQKMEIQEFNCKNLTERKNLHTPVYGVKEFFLPSVCLSVTPIRTGRTERAKKLPRLPPFAGVCNLPHKFNLY